MIPVTPRGAGTGLAAGAVPFWGDGHISGEDEQDSGDRPGQNFLLVEPGVTTGDEQRCAQDWAVYAGDPCSADSSFIGGNIANQCRGNKAVKYGVTAQHVFGLEVVFPNGDIAQLGGKTIKEVSDTV
jgi:glycolate oxidase